MMSGCEYCAIDDDRKQINVGDTEKGFNLFGGVSDYNGERSNIELCVAYKHGDALEVFNIPISYCPMCGRKLDGKMR